MKKNLLILFIVFSTFSFSQIPSGYYDGTTDLSGYALKTQLHIIISNGTYSWNYDSDLEDLYAITDLDKYYENDGSFLDIYTENPTASETEFFPTDADPFIGSASSEGLGLNKEHIIPQTTYYSEYPMYSDMHFVIPADARINQLRNYYPYGISKTTSSNIFYTFTNGSKIGYRNNPGTEYKGRVYEPIEEFRGDIARMIFYFVVRYEDKLPDFKSEIYYSSVTQDATTDVSVLDGTQERALDPWFLTQLLQWNIDDPVSQREIDRNNEVYNIQKNRNPFIDHPEWIDAIWNQTSDATAPNAPINLMITKTGAHFVSLSWAASTSSDVIGYQIYVDGVLTSNTKKTTYVLDHLDPSTTYNISVKAYDNGYLYSSDSNLVSATTLALDSYSSDLLISKYIEGTTSSTTKVFNNAIEIYNNTGHDVDLNNYKLNIQYYSSTSGNYYFSDPFQLEGSIADGEVFVIINPEADFSCFAVEDAQFITAASPMMFSGSQYVELAYKSNTVDAIGTIGISNSNNNVSLYRLPNVSQPTSTFDINEWQQYAMNYCTDLGVLATKEITALENEISLYPNPVIGDELFVKGNNLNKVSVAKIFDISGRAVYEESNPFKSKNSINIKHLKAGIYILTLDQKSYKFIKK